MIDDPASRTATRQAVSVSVATGLSGISFSALSVAAAPPRRPHRPGDRPPGRRRRARAHPGHSPPGVGVLAAAVLAIVVGWARPDVVVIDSENTDDDARA